MFKHHLLAVIMAVALILAATGTAGLVADALGLPMTPQAYACGGGGSGGNC